MKLLFRLSLNKLKASKHSNHCCDTLWVLRWHQLGVFAIRMGTSTPLNWLGTLNPSPGLLSFSPFKQPFHCSHQPSGPSSGSFLITQPCWSNTLDISDAGRNAPLDVAWRGWFEVKMLLLFGTFWDIPVMLSDTYHVHQFFGQDENWEHEGHMQDEKSELSSSVTDTDDFLGDVLELLCQIIS